MSEANRPALEDDLDSLRERKRFLDNMWLLTLPMILIALGVPWFLRVLDLDLAPVAWSLFAFAAVYAASIYAFDRLSSRRSLLSLVAGVQAAGVVFLGILWHLAGSLQNPMFLLVFVLPVVAASVALMGWLTYTTAGFSMATVVIVALRDAPDLRWYLIQSGLPVWFLRLFPEHAAYSSRPFPGVSAPPSYHLVVLELFAVSMLTLALMSESFISFLLRIHRRWETSTAALGRLESLFLNLLRASPSPIALVYADTFKIAEVSQSFLHHFMLDPESLLARNLFELIGFSDAEPVKELMSGAGGEIAAVYRIKGEIRIARVSIYPISHGGIEYAYLNIQDASDWHLLTAALNSLDEPLVLVSAQRKILYFNQAARDLFQNLRTGAEAAAVFETDGLPLGWWDPGLRSRVERRLELTGKPYVANCFATKIPGEREALTLLRLRPAGSGQ